MSEPLDVRTLERLRVTQKRASAPRVVDLPASGPPSTIKPPVDPEALPEPEPKRTHKCQYCGSMFAPNRPNQKYCPTGCYNEFHIREKVRRQRERRKKQ